MVAGWIREGMPKDQIVVNAGKAEKDWDYVWGATGQRCTVAQRKAFISRQRAKGYEGEAQETIKKCQVLNGSAVSCAGCKFYCDGKGTLIHDCQGFVKEICSRVGITLSGGGSNSMWNNNANWTKKGSIKDMPEQVCCIFWTGKNKDGKIVKSHIGFYIGGGMMVHCSGCVKVEKLSSKCTDYALIKGLGGVVPPVPPVPPPEPVPEGYAEVTGKKVALRKDPSLQANILLRVDTGETVKLEQLPPKEWSPTRFTRSQTPPTTAPTTCCPPLRPLFAPSTVTRSSPRQTCPRSCLLTLPASAVRQAATVPTSVAWSVATSSTR